MTNIGNENRAELHEKLSLTGAEVSINRLPAGASVPFVHSHKSNEEIYGILSDKGKSVIDGEEIELATGDWLKISPEAKRQFYRRRCDNIIVIISIHISGEAYFVSLRLYVRYTIFMPIRCVCAFSTSIIRLKFKREVENINRCMNNSQ